MSADLDELIERLSRHARRQYAEQIHAAERRGAVKALRGFAAGFALDNLPVESDEVA
jgi:hypothetical protein